MNAVKDRPVASRLGSTDRQSIENELSISTAVSNVEPLYRRVLGR